jgi:hypothetical protein
MALNQHERKNKLHCKDKLTSTLEFWRPNSPQQRPQHEMSVLVKPVGDRPWTEFGSDL